MKRDNTLLIILPILLVLLVAPHVTRILANNPYPFGSETYETLRLTHQYRVTGTMTYDVLADMAIPFTLIIPLLACITTETTPVFVLQLVAILLGLLTTLLLYDLYHRHVKAERRFYMIFLLIISPSYLAVFTQFSALSVSVFVAVLAVWLLTRSRICVVAGAILFAVLPLLHPFVALATIIVLAVYMFMRRRITELLYPILTIVFGFVCAYVLSGNVLFSLVRPSSYVGSFLAEVGAFGGYSIPSIILAVIGFYVAWKKSLSYIVGSLVFIGLFVLSYFLPVFIPVFGIVLNVYAGYGLWDLTRRRWSFSVLRYATLLLILCTLLFSTVAFVNRLAVALPSQEMVAGFVSLRQTSSRSVILALPEYAPFIRSVAGRPVVLDEDTATSQEPHAVTTRAAVDALYSSRNIEETIKLVRELGVTHVFVDERTRDFLTERGLTGLFFLFVNSDIFINVYDENNITIWAYDSDAAAAYLAST